MFCPSCGQQCNPDEAFCPHCGAALNAAPDQAIAPAEPEKKDTAKLALILSIVSITFSTVLHCTCGTMPAWLCAIFAMVLAVKGQKEADVTGVKDKRYSIAIYLSIASLICSIIGCVIAFFSGAALGFSGVFAGMME